jgi:hypothetical protein
MLCSVVAVVYQCFGGICCLWLQGEVLEEKGCTHTYIGPGVQESWQPVILVVGGGASSDWVLQVEMMVSYCNTTWHHNPEDNLNLHCHENFKSMPILFSL